MRFSKTFNMEFQQENLDFIDISLNTNLQFPLIIYLYVF